MLWIGVCFVFSVCLINNSLGIEKILLLGSPLPFLKPLPLPPSPSQPPLQSFMLHCHATLKNAYFRFAAPVRHCKPKGLPLKRSMSLARYSFRRETTEWHCILSCSMSRASTKLAFIRFAAPVAIAYPFSIKSRPRELAVAMFYARWFSLTAQILH